MKKLVIKNKLKSESSVGSVPSIGVFLLLCVYPFAFSRGYKDITYTRFMFFCLVSIVVFEICAIRLLSKTSSVEAVVRKWFSTSTATDKAFLCFFVSALAAFVFSEYKYAAVLGDLGRYMGFLIFFAIFLMYLWVSRFYILTERDMRFFCIVCICIAVFSFLKFEGVDLFGIIIAYCCQCCAGNLASCNVFGVAGTHIAYTNDSVTYHISLLLYYFGLW